jgi:signal transduction histidine kinase
MATALNQLTWADLRDRQPPFRLTAVIRQETGPAGSLTIMGHGRLVSVSLVSLMALNLAVVPIFLLLCGVSLIVTPWIVRRSLAGVVRIAAEANRIDIERRGVRLTETEVPREIAPLVRAVNEALSRLDDGYERQRRFIASAAHELRTPIAILRIKTETAGETAVRRLGGEIDRLANLAEQLLDLQRLDGALSTKQIDLALLVRQVAADLAPLLIAADRDVEVVIEDAKSICGDAGAIERAITNLVQNAIQHGGRHLILRVLQSTIEVEDNGPGIPPDERARVFEPFHRVRPRPSGSGLGLNLVQQVVDRHGGSVSIVEARGGGTIVRMVFPPAEA